MKKIISAILIAAMIVAMVPAVSVKADTGLGKAISTAYSDADGIHVEWDSVKGADGYGVYRRVKGTSSWKGLRYVYGTTYIDSAIDKGVTYEYVIRAYVNTNGTKVQGPYSSSDCSEAVWLDTPVLESATSVSNGIKVTWKDVDCATSYRIYRRLPSGSYEYIATAAGTSYTDTKAPKGAAYYYTVRAYANNARSGFNRTGICAVNLDKVTTSASGDANGITITWNTVKGASGYKLYRRVKGTTPWSTLGFFTNTTYLDSTAEKSVTYEYVVRPYITINGVRYLGYYNTLERSHCIWLNTPVINATVMTYKGIDISWEPVDCATSYRIYRREEGGSFAYLGMTKDTSYSDNTAECGKTYLYTVRAYEENTRSNFNRTGVYGVYLTNSPLTDIVSDTANGVKLTYTKVAGADGYRVYRRKIGYTGGWTALANVSSTTYTDTTSIKDIEYEYVVRPYKKAGGITFLGQWKKTDVMNAVGVGKIWVIVIDPGHDTDHSGATCIDGTNELVPNLKIALALKAELEKYDGVVVYLTHETEACPFPGSTDKECLINRNLIGKSVGCDYYISIHNNAMGGVNTTARGAEVFYPNTNYKPEYSTLGKTMGANILAELTGLGLKYRGLFTRTDDEREYIYPDNSSADYYNVIRNAKLNGYVGLIIEHAFVDNSEDYYGFLNTDKKLAALGQADARGIAKTLGLTRK